MIILAAGAVVAGGAAAAPTIDYINFDGRTISSNDLVRPDASITIKVSSSDADGVSMTLSSLEVDAQLNIPFNSPTYGTNYADGILTYRTNFADGTHTLRVYAVDNAGDATVSAPVVFRTTAAGVLISGRVLNYKNPFNPGKGESTAITYMLSTNADISIYIYSLIGQPIKKIFCPLGAEGGHAGYNSVVWDGYSDTRELAGNDVYLVRVVSGGKLIGKGKIAVIK